MFQNLTKITPIFLENLKILVFVLWDVIRFSWFVYIIRSKLKEFREIVVRESKWQFIKPRIIRHMVATFNFRFLILILFFRSRQRSTRKDLISNKQNRYNKETMFSWTLRNVILNWALILSSFNAIKLWYGFCFVIQEMMRYFKASLCFIYLIFFVLLLLFWHLKFIL